MNRASRKSLLTAKERVILHLLPLQRYAHDADAPRTVTQDGISEAVDVGRNNVAKILQELEDQKLIEIYTKHVKGLPSVRKVYFLTQKGFEDGKKMKDEIETLRINIVDLNGDEHEDDIGRLTIYLPKTYPFLDLVMGIERGRFDSRSFHESKTKEERRFVDFTDKKPAVRTFFGREREMQTLYGLLDPDGTRAVVIFGIPGIGKTTLIAKFAQDVRDKTNVFWLKVHEWVNVGGLLRPLAEFLSQLGKKNLEWYLNQRDTPQTGEVLQILITDLKDVPALIILDDVHKSERTVNELLGALMGVLDEMPSVRIICATRDLPLFYSRGLVLKNAVVELQLEGLDGDSSLRMLKARSMPDDQMEQMIKITKGHPLFLELIEDADSALGKNIRMFIDQEVVSKLDTAEKRIMNVAAVFRYPVIIDAFFITEEEIRKELHGMDAGLEDLDYSISYETVDSLLSKSILHESVGRMIGMHDLLREFTYTRLTPRQRMLYHQSAARFYAQDSSTSSQVEALYHYINAKDVQKAVEIAAGRGEEIINMGYSNQFAPLLQKLLLDPKVVERVELLLLHGIIMDLAGEYDKAIDDLMEVLSLRTSGENGRVLAETSRRIGTIEIKRSHFEEALSRLQNAEKFALGIDDTATLADIYYDLGGLAERRARFPEALEYFNQAGKLAKEVGDRSAMGRSYYGVGRVRASLGDHTEGVRFKKEALSVLERAGDASSMSKVHIGLANDLKALGQQEESIRHFENAIKIAESIGDVGTLAYAKSNMAADYLERKDLVRAEDLVHQATMIFQKMNDQMMLSMMHLYRGFIFHYRGDWDWAKEEFQSALSMIRNLDAPNQRANFLLEIAKAYKDNGEKDVALIMLNEAKEVAMKIGNDKILSKVRSELER